MMPQLLKRALLICYDTFSYGYGDGTHRHKAAVVIYCCSSSDYSCDCSIELKSVVTAGGNDAPWVSPLEEFAFGFRPLPPSADADEDLFLLSIWYHKIPEQTIVWSKNDHPLPKGSTVQLTDEGQLVLYDPGLVEQWRAGIGRERLTCAAMLDSGNLVLINGDSTRIWESFSFPTDTILPGQRLLMAGNLTSRQSDTNYSDGRFQLRMQTDGNLVLYTIFLPTQDINTAYWDSRTVEPNTDSQLIFNEAGYIYIQQGNHAVYNFTQRGMGSEQDFYFLARLDADGVFRLYHHPRSRYATVGTCTSAWSVVQATPEDICSRIIGDIGSGACGYNSYCVSSEEGMASCRCPQGYSFLDPLNPNGGCKPDFPLPSCLQNGWEMKYDLVDFKELNNTDWPLTDYELQTGPQVDKDSCKEFCRRDCFCAAAIYFGNNCWKKRFPLSNGRQSQAVNRIAFIKVPKINATTSSLATKDRSNTAVIVLSALLGSSVFVNVLLLVSIAVAIFFLYHKKLLRSLHSSSTVCGMRVFSYNELEEATGGFEQQVGRGSFGTVYKGFVPTIPKRYIAIKRLDKVEKQGEKEFATEVSAIGQTHHKNLVTLLGYCDEGDDHRLLVYEYMSNGSLASHLFGLSRPHWNQRMQIAFGIARGLTYLHEECSTQIIHCDVKPQNILLDEYLTPKISDFGMAKLLLSEQSRVARTHIRGTVGYFAPEWFRKASISTKVDVYSFGVMLLEIVCCMSSVGFAMGDEDDALVDWVYDCYSKKKLDKLVENDEEARNDMKSVERAVMVGIWCIQEDPYRRPSMRRVTQMLEGVAQVSVPPSPSFLTSSS